MKRWKKSDIGKRIIYLGENTKYNEVIIYDVNENTPNTVKFVEYPLTLGEKVGVIESPIGLLSKIGIAGIVKSQEKEDKKYISKPGDWCFIDKVSNDQMRELERIAHGQRHFK